ncbi:MAG TPA: STAS domain-containing protein [Spirochaetota bacterium]|mgnify:FL=1|nr:STAS domain-containing protein [Spirochaetota bacterium]HOT19242.1 STAS domain-containing protein [Spirochaetota bacterium]HPD04339.1 STAS domain-containing protein [Spirochaetota bacterium]HQG41331.1 STAS domain-containing protein [Spirochaetota bacterium]HQI37152.1 STAS domain-containing protein [Spirochaetota bacterium]
MNLKTKKVGNIVVVYLQGRLDVHLSADIEKEINKLIKDDPASHLLLNLAGVEYMSSSGLRIFVSTMRILKESNRKLKICSMNNAVKKIFEVVELMDMFEIYETEEEAIASFK